MLGQTDTKHQINFFFDSDEKVYFTLDCLLVKYSWWCLSMLTKYITRHTQSLNRFLEFIIVLIKLRLNVSFQELAYHFVVSISTVSRIFDGGAGFQTFSPNFLARRNVFGRQRLCPFNTLLESRSQ